MLLLEAADVQTGDGNWTLGGQEVDRSCSLEVLLSDYCGLDPENAVIISPLSPTAMPYETKPFGIIGRFRRSVMCSRPDDESWLNQQMQDVTEQAVARALVTQSVYGTEAWIGADGVTEVPLPTGDETLGDAVCAAYTAWTDHNVGQPLMHVAPCALPGLVQEGVAVVENGKLYSVWGPEIITSPGYLSEPPVFFTGPITVNLSSIEVEEARSVRNNQGLVEGTRVGLIEMAPCSAVRVGPVSDDSFAPPPPDPETMRVDIDGQHATVHIDNALQGASGSVDWGDGYRDSWSQSSPDPAQSPTLTHTYATSGNFTVTLRPGGQTEQVTVEEPPEPTPEPAQPTLTVPDLTMQPNQSGVQQQTTLVNNEGESQNCTGRITLTGAAPLSGRITMWMVDFFGPGTGNVTVAWTVSGSDLVGTYPGGDGFPIANPLDGATTNRWTLGSGAQTGQYPAKTEILDSDGGVLASDSWALTVE